MTDEELEALLDDLEAALLADVTAALALTAQDFADALDGATELVAARFSVSRIRDMWRRRVGGIMDRLRSISGRAAEVAADDAGTDLPNDWDENLAPYLKATRALLDAVGDRLASEASQSLAEGLNAGEDLDQLKARLAAVFAQEGTQLGAGRAQRIAMTEATRAFNAGTLAAAQAMTGPDRPLVKQWLTRNDARVRDAHRETDGQLQLLDDPFDVDGTPMQYPGDPTAPAALTVNCFPGDTRVQVPVGLRRVYRHWYEGDLVRVRTADGTELSGTPNHPVLTLSGWQPLKSLQVGDKLIQSGGAERVGLGDPHVKHLPPTLAEVYRAADKLSLAGRVGAGSVNFHGDVPDSDVDVVPILGHLGPDDEAGLTEELSDAFLFSPGSGLRDFLRAREAELSLSPVDAAVVLGLPDSSVGGSSVGGSFFESHALHAQSVGLTDSANGDTSLYQASADYGAAGAEFLSNGLLGLSSLVAHDDIVGVDVEPFAGHVYNLESVEGWYSANGITSHNCRCIMKVTGAEQAASAEGTLDVDQEVTAAADGQTFQSNMPAQLKRYWLTGEGAAKIRWGTPGSFDRCVRALRDDFPENTEGLCANLHHEATGKWPRENSSGADVHTGAMLALMPTEEDAARLALEGGEAADQLHLTLFYLGDAVNWSAEQQGDLISRVSYAARLLTPVHGMAFGGAQWNPASDEPAWVWNVGNNQADPPGSTLEDAKFEITWALEDGHNDPELPQQYTPWSPHICAVYDTDNWADRLAAKVGPVTFDRVRVAFAGQYTDIPLTGGYMDELDDIEPAPEVEPIEYEQPPQLLTWSTPGATALAFENQQTGDGRVFAPGALYWSGGPWPLQYADEMNGGHDGARLAGAIFDMARDGDRITGAGVLYLALEAGAEAAMLLSSGAPLGVSVDLDDVDLALVDTSGDASLTDGRYSAHLITASLLPLPDGGWRLTGETAADWTASVSGTMGESSRVDIVVGPDGRVPADAFELSAAAGDPGTEGEVVQHQLSGDVLMRVTRARVRGATLVTIPAFADAAIVLEDPTLFASVSPDQVTAAAAASNYDRVVRHVRKSLIPVTAADAATFLRLPISDVRRYLARAAKKGTIVRIAHGRYVAPTETTATAVAAAATDSDELTAALEVAGDELSQVEPDDVREEMEASAWSAVRDLPPMPAAWFAAPTDEELPPGGPGVNYRDGRIFGWVAQAGEPHAGFAKKVTIDGLGKIDTSHFLRQRFTLDDGSTVKVGAFTMNVGHHRDGAECETSACQFDDSRTVAGIVTVGMSDRGMWFSGAAAPWISEWDRSVFLATQPSYHMKKGPSGNWQLRAVLSVPVPGHSSPLLASAVVDRANMALTAAATMVEAEDAIKTEEDRQSALSAAAAEAEGVTAPGVIDYDRLADALVSAMVRADQKKLDDAAELAALLDEGRSLD